MNIYIGKISRRVSCPCGRFCLKRHVVAFYAGACTDLRQFVFLLYSMGLCLTMWFACVARYILSVTIPCMTAALTCVVRNHQMAVRWLEVNRISKFLHFFCVWLTWNSFVTAFLLMRFYISMCLWVNCSAYVIKHIDAAL